MGHLSNDHNDLPNQPKNSHNLSDEMRHSILSLAESKWKLKEQHDQNFPMGEAITEQILASEERKKYRTA